MATGHFTADQPSKSYSFFLLGKTGSGKSRTGNSILGNPIAFKFGTPTDDCTVETIEDKSGKTIHVIDTPSDASADPNVKKIEELMNQYKENSILIFIFCIQIGRFNDSDYLTFEKYRGCLGNSIFSHSVVIFTCYDQWENDMKDKQIEDPDFKSYISSLSHQNKSLLHRCGRQWVAFNNRLKGDENDFQVNNLLKKIDEKFSSVCPSQKAKLKKLFFGPEKDIADTGAVPRTRKLKQTKED